MHLLGAWVLFDFIFMIFIYVRVDLKSFICLHLKQKNTEEAVTAHELPTD